MKVFGIVLDGAPDTTGADAVAAMSREELEAAVAPVRRWANAPVALAVRGLLTGNGPWGAIGGFVREGLDGDDATFGYRIVFGGGERFGLVPPLAVRAAREGLLTPEEVATVAAALSMEVPSFAVADKPCDCPRCRAARDGGAKQPAQ